MQNPTLSQEDLITIYKTMQANDGITDVAALTGGGALSRQFLDATLASIVLWGEFRTLHQLLFRRRRIGVHRPPCVFGTGSRRHRGHSF